MSENVIIPILPTKIFLLAISEVLVANKVAFDGRAYCKCSTLLPYVHHKLSKFTQNTRV